MTARTRIGGSPRSSAGATAIIARGGIPPEAIATAEAAILSGSPRSILDSVRVLRSQTPLLIAPQADGADIVAYALLPEVEDGRTVIPGWTMRHAPAVAEYLRRFAQGDIGDVRLVQMDRTEAALTEASTPLLSLDRINERFLEDVDLLRLLGGDYHRITAVPVGSTAAGVARMSVTLAVDGAAEAVSSISPGATHGWTLVVTGTRGTARLQRIETEPITLQVNGASLPLAAEDADAAAVRSFVNRIARQDATQNSRTPAATWTDFIRATDLLQGLHRSLRRRRTIELHFESTSERSQFKTQMTAIGCGVLTWALLGTCLGLMLGSALDPRDSTERRASAAGTIVWTNDFAADETTLPSEAARRLVEHVQREGEQAIVLIEPAGAAEFGRVDSDRLSHVEQLLRQSEETERAQITVRPLAGRWYHGLMLTIWIVSFVPLAVFLLSQLLLGLTRGSAGSSKRTDNEI